MTKRPTNFAAEIERFMSDREPQFMAERGPAEMRPEIETLIRNVRSAATYVDREEAMLALKRIVGERLAIELVYAA